MRRGRRDTGRLKGTPFRGLNVIERSPYSPDLKPIKTGWSKIKNDVAEITMSNSRLDNLRDVVITAWELIG